MKKSGYIQFNSRACVRAFANPVEIVAAQSVGEVSESLSRVRSAVASGKWAAGYLAYEAAPALDSALTTHAATGAPPLWFGIYDGPAEAVDDQPPYSLGEWRPGLSLETYRERAERIRDYIGAGDTYQVNFTFPLRASFTGDALSWFRDLCAAQQADHCAYIDTGRYQLVCASPELFFVFDADGTLTTKPMKGTRTRGRWLEEDERIADELATSVKDRAENVMIVDLLRNDVGKVSDIGSVRVERLFEIERYPTIWQMTSTIRSTTPRNAFEVLAALFPSGSVTGAPKIRTMQIIREMEQGARGAYCGAMGWIAPDGNAEFNVAIRCATIDRDAGSAEYPVGSGITWGSDPEAEYAECLSKAAVLSHRPEPFELLESLLYDGDYFVLDEHMARLERSAIYFGFAIDSAKLRDTLLTQAAQWDASPKKVRLLVSRDGNFEIQSAPVTPLTPVRLGIATTSVNSSDIFLFHKTTRRTTYDSARATRPDCDDVVLWNERGEVTESCYANIVVELDGELLTPPVDCGLLAGTFREQLLRNGTISERVITRMDLQNPTAIHLINSVRKWIPVEFVPENTDTV